MATLRRSFPTFLRTFIHHRRYAQQPPATLNSTVVSGKIPGGSSEHGTTQEISAKSTNAQNSLKNMSETSNPRKSPFDSLGMSLNAPLTGERSMIDGLGPTTFTISGVRVKGSVLIMPTYSTLWKIDEWTDLCPAAFTLVKVSLPRPDIVVLGTGASILPVSKAIANFFSDIHVSLEVLDTKNASHTFNILNQESRNVAAALIPLGYHHDSER